MTDQPATPPQAPMVTLDPGPEHIPADPDSVVFETASGEWPDGLVWVEEAQAALVVLSQALNNRSSSEVKIASWDLMRLAFEHGYLAALHDTSEGQVPDQVPALYLSYEPGAAS